MKEISRTEGERFLSILPIGLSLQSLLDTEGAIVRALALKAVNGSAFTFPCIVTFAAFTTA